MIVISSCKTLVLLLVLLLVVSLNSISQSNQFLEGYIIKTNNDTIYGSIRNENSINNQKDCFFKADGSDQIVLYTPRDLIVYQITNRSEYLSKLITVNRINTQQVFIQRIASGKINLYRYFTEIGIRYFIEKEKEDGFLELIERNNSFRGLLNYILSDCKYANTDIFKLRYDESALKERINQYNNCDNPIDLSANQLQTKRPRPKRVISYGPIIGGGLDQINVSSSTSDFGYLENIDFETYLSPNIGFFIKISSPSLNNKIDFEFELLYGYRKFKGDSEFLLPPNITERNFVLIEMHSLLLPLTVNFKPFDSKWEPYFEVGVTPRFAFDEVNARVFEEEIANTVFINQSEVFEFKPLEIGLALGIGSNFKINDKKKIGWKLRYLLGNGLDDEQTGSLLSTTSNLQLLISYQFIK